MFHCYALFRCCREPYHYVRFDDWDEEHYLLIVGPRMAPLHVQRACRQGGCCMPGSRLSSAHLSLNTNLVSFVQLMHVSEPSSSAGGEDHKTGSLWPYDPYDRWTLCCAMPCCAVLLCAVLCLAVSEWGPLCHAVPRYAVPCKFTCRARCQRWR